MTKKEQYLFIASLLALPVIIYCYFLKWQTTTIYGDDLYIFKDHFAQLSNHTPGTKFRPVNSFFTSLLIDIFQKRLACYYVFNVGVQTINTYLFALVVNLFLQSRWLSVMFSLIIGLSRFSIYNITQLFNGGTLEGMALSFFLLSLFFVLRPVIQNGESPTGTQRNILWSILFANLSFYTHERYIVLMPFIMLVVVLFPISNIISRKRKTILCLLCIVSVLINVGLKKYVYSMPFFVGTSDTNITFSINSALSFFKDGVSSILQFNAGPEFLTGIQFSSLLQPEKRLIILLAACLSIALAFFFIRTGRGLIQQKKTSKIKLYLFSILCVLFILCLVPVVITIRLEQRWLQASFAIFVLLIAIALTSFKPITQKILVPVFVLMFAWINFTYLNKGVGNFFQSSAERMTLKFKKAIHTNIILPNTSRLYIWKYVDVDGKSALTWELCNGYFFDFYGQKSRELIFADSLSQIGSASPLKVFNKNSDQVIYVTDSVTDITDQYLKDSLRTFITK